MAKRRQFPVDRQLLHGPAFPDGVGALDQVHHLALEHEKTAVDPGAITPRFLFESGHPRVVPTQREGAKPPRWLHRGDRRKCPLCAVKCDQARDVDIADAVAISAAKRSLFQVARCLLDPPARHRFESGVNQRDLPRLGGGAQHGVSAVAHVESDIGAVQGVITKKLFDQMAFVATADHEVAQPVRQIHFHDVPENWLAAYFDQRLGANRALFANPGAVAARQNHDLHIVSFLLIAGE